MMNFYAFYLNAWRRASLESKGANIMLMDENLIENPGTELRRVPGIGTAVCWIKIEVLFTRFLETSIFRECNGISNCRMRR